MKKKNALHTKLLLYYGVLITLILFVVFYCFYYYISGSLRNQASRSLNTLSSTVSARMDDTIKQMSANSTKILYSSELKELIYSDALYGHNMKSLSSQREFNNTFYSIMGPQMSVPQVNIFREDGHYISIGNYTAFGNAGKTLNTFDWYQISMKNNGTFLLSPPHVNEWTYYNLPVLSLYRSFSSQFGKKTDAVIEIQLDYSALKTLISDMNITQQLYILDKNGEFVYPLEASEGNVSLPLIHSYWKEIYNRTDTGTFTAKDNETKEKSIISYTNSSYTGFSILVLENERTMLSPIRNFRTNLIVIGFLSLFVTLFVSYFIAHKVTVPVRQMYTSIRKLSLNTLGEGQDEQLKNSWNELDILNNSFLEMKERLEQSLEETISSKSHEIHAKMLALQSQMNPHFLYNTLTTISIMAENEGKQNITEMCDSLTSMLRYISDDEPGLVTIEKEFNHTLDFLNLIKIRYGENLCYTMQIPPNMFSIPLPKMVVEPLVENCVKYAMNGRPPWHLTVLGTVTETAWTISVKDTGAGFSTQSLQDLRKTFATLDPQKEIPNLKLNGMGLINIFVRLKLVYGENAVFAIENLPDSGACVTIGGPHSLGKDVCDGSV